MDPSQNTAVPILLKKIADNEPPEKVIEFIEKQALAKFFDPEHEEITRDNYDSKKIAQACREELPALYRFNEHLSEVTTAIAQQIEAQVTNIDQLELYRDAELYKTYPGVKTGNCWVDTAGLPSVNLGQKYIDGTN